MQQIIETKYNIGDTLKCTYEKPRRDENELEGQVVDVKIVCEGVWIVFYLVETPNKERRWWKEPALERIRDNQIEPKFKVGDKVLFDNDGEDLIGTIVNVVVFHGEDNGDDEVKYLVEQEGHYSDWVHEDKISLYKADEAAEKA